jgi:hypothetical protein
VPILTYNNHRIRRSSNTHCLSREGRDTAAWLRPRKEESNNEENEDTPDDLGVRSGAARKQHQEKGREGRKAYGRKSISSMIS